MKDARLPLEFRACGPCVATWVATRWALPGVAAGIAVAVVAGVETGSGFAIGASYLGVFMGLAIVGYCRSRSIVVDATTVNLKGAQARLQAEAARRGITLDQLIAAVADSFPAEDPFDAFIGSSSSGRGDLARRHREIRAEQTAGRTARDV